MEGPRQSCLRPPPRSLGTERPQDPSSGRLEGMAGVARMAWVALSTQGPPLWPAMAHSIRTCRRTLSITEATM